MPDIADLDPFTAAAALEWLLEAGCDEAICEQPLNRYALPEKMPGGLPGPGAAPPAAPALRPETGDPVAEAERAAAGPATLEELRAALLAYPHCEIRLGARSTVFADGDPGARVMVVGEAPGREEDRAGTPFAGAEGALLDRMFAAIGLARAAGDPARALYLTTVLPWRPPSNRDPSPVELAMMTPFLRRHVELADPEIVVLMGNQPCDAVLGQRGITRLRGSWTTGFDRPALPMLPPSYLMRQPLAKREAWADLLALAARLDG